MQSWPLPDFEHKICPPESLPERLAALPRPLVFTNGCFDILHRGHVTYLAQARANRAAVAAALASVDIVTWFDSDTPAALIEAVQPDILVKGGDWAPQNIVGAAETLARGGQVYSIPFLHQTSTTQTLAKIRAAEGKK